MLFPEDDMEPCRAAAFLGISDPSRPGCKVFSDAFRPPKVSVASALGEEFRSDVGRRKYLISLTKIKSDHSLQMPV